MLFRSMMPGLMDNGLYGVFGIHEALNVPPLLVSFKGRFKVSDLVNLAKFRLSSFSNLSSMPPSLASILVSYFSATNRAFSANCAFFSAASAALPFSFFVATTMSLRAFFQLTSSATSFNLSSMTWVSCMA